MSDELSAAPGGSGCGLSGCAIWFIGGVALSFSLILALVAVVLLVASVGLNAYLVWQLSELEITISRMTPSPPAVVVVTATPQSVVILPTETPTVRPEPTETPTPVPVGVRVEEQMSTVAAIATQASGLDNQADAFIPPPAETAVYAAVPIDPSRGQDGSETAESEPPALPKPINEPQAPAAPAEAEPAEESSFQASNTPQPAQAAAAISSNSFDLIPIEGERESRPAEEHGDLNLKLREPQPIDVALELVDIDNAGIDPNAPRFSEAFEPSFKAAYTVHNWDWSCNCKGELIQDEQVVLVGLKTTPGEPIFIPPKDQDVFQGKYYATVLYASEDSLTFVYARTGTVAKGYTMHYLGLRTDPNLLARFRESQGNELPGLTLDTPVGVATDELIVAIRDNGTFMDVRSRKDWWD